MLEYAAKFANIRIMKTIFKLLPVLCFAFMLCGCASLNVLYTPTNNVNTEINENTNKSSDELTEKNGKYIGDIVNGKKQGKGSDGITVRSV